MVFLQFLNRVLHVGILIWKKSLTFRPLRQENIVNYLHAYIHIIIKKQYHKKMVNLHAFGNAKLYVKESQGPTQEFFTNMEISPLPVKGCKFWPMLGTHGHWAVCHTYCDMGHPFKMVISEDLWHSLLMPIKHLAVELSYYLFLWLKSVTDGIIP